MVKEYRVNLKGSTQGNYIIAPDAITAKKRVRKSRDYYKHYPLTSFQVILWKTGKNNQSLKLTAAAHKKMSKS